MNKQLPLAWLPNQEGFQFVGVHKDGTTSDCVVIRKENGLHTVENYFSLCGWLEK